MRVLAFVAQLVFLFAIACGDNRALFQDAGVGGDAPLVADAGFVDARDLDAPPVDAALDAPVDAPPDATPPSPPPPPDVEATQEGGDNNFPWIVIETTAPADTTLRVYADATCSGPVLLELVGPYGPSYEQVTSPVADNTTFSFCGTQTNSAGTSACACDAYVWTEDSSLPPNGGDISCAIDVHHASGAAVAADSDGSVVVAGYFTGPVTLGAGEPNETTLGAAAGLYVARYRADCSLAWAREVIGPVARAALIGNNFGTGLVVGPEGVAVAGTFTGMAIFGPGEATQAILSSSGNSGFVARFDPAGQLVGVGEIETAGVVQVTGLARSAGGELYIGGVLDAATATFGPGEPAQTLVTGAGSSNMFVARYLASGAFDWVRATTATSLIGANGIAAAPDGSVVITGFLQGTATFGAGEPNETTRASYNGFGADIDVIVARYLDDGSFAWVAQAGGYGRHWGNGITVAPDGLTATITGRYGEPYGGGVAAVTFGAGEPSQTTLSNAGTETEAFVARYDVAAGSLVWARRVTDAITSDHGQAIASTSDGGAIVTGVFGGPSWPGITEFGPQPFELWSKSYDMFVARYSPAGDLLWVRQGGGDGSLDDSYGVAVSSDDSATVVGQFQRTALFDPANPFAVWLSAAPGQIDAYIARFGP